MPRRLLRSAAWTLSVTAFLTAALTAWSFAKPSWISRGSMSAGLVRGQVEIGWGSGTIVRDPKYWVIKNPQGYASILVGPRSLWRPTLSRASMGMSAGPAPTPLFKLSALYLPLWLLMALFGGGAAFMWWRSRRISLPGHCRKCGYNLEGLAGGPCPECGTPQSNLVTRIVQALQQVRPTGPRTRPSLTTAP
jgi:hypothetical protein